MKRKWKLIFQQHKMFPQPLVYVGVPVSSAVLHHQRMLASHRDGRQRISQLTRPCIIWYGLNQWTVPAYNTWTWCFPGPDLYKHMNTMCMNLTPDTRHTHVRNALYMVNICKYIYMHYPSFSLIDTQCRDNLFSI